MTGPERSYQRKNAVGEMTNERRLRLRRARAGGRRDDGGLTLIEMVVTVALTSIVMAITTFIIVQVTTETNAERATASGIEQAQLSEKFFTQYLRSVDSLVGVGRDDIVFTTLTGMGASDTPGVDKIEALLCPTANPKMDALEIIYGLPKTGTDSGGVHTCIANSSVALPAGVTLGQTFDIVPPSGANAPDIFSYYSYSGTTFNLMTTAQAQASLASVAAIGVSLSFLPPVGSGRGFGVEESTRLQTITVMRNIACVSQNPNCLA
jgi:prepilin-type N-terminal cleavage/methylation domain-containing protein